MVQKACTAKIPDSASALLAFPSMEDAQLSSCKCLSISINEAKVQHVTQERAKSMWDKAEQLLNTDGFILPAAGAANTACQVVSLTGQKSGKFETPHYVYTHKRLVGVEVKCDCPVHRSSPNTCQHALAAAEDLHVLSDYLLWMCKTKKSVNVSQLISSSVPKDAGKKPSTRHKGAAKAKRNTSAELISVPMSSQGPALSASLPSTADMVDIDKELSVSMPSTVVPLSSSHGVMPSEFVPTPLYLTSPYFDFPMDSISHGLHHQLTKGANCSLHYPQ